MKLSDFFILLDIKDTLTNEEHINELNILLDKIADETEKGNIEDDREPATIDDITTMLNENTEYNWEVSK